MKIITKKERVIDMIRSDRWHTVPTRDTVDKIFDMLLVDNNLDILMSFAEYWNNTDSSLIEERDINKFLKDEYLSPIKNSQ